MLKSAGVWSIYHRCVADLFCDKSNPNIKIKGEVFIFTEKLSATGLNDPPKLYCSTNPAAILGFH